jgi:hypothetical protein
LGLDVLPLFNILLHAEPALCLWSTKGLPKVRISTGPPDMAIYRIFFEIMDFFLNFFMSGFQVVSVVHRTLVKGALVLLRWNRNKEKGMVKREPGILSLR